MYEYVCKIHMDNDGIYECFFLYICAPVEE